MELSSAMVHSTAIGALAPLGSFIGSGTLGCDGSLQQVGTLTDLGSLAGFGTLQHHDSLQISGTLIRYGSLWR